ncbi:hypothetical protein [Alicyclobacillus sp. SO9]|uniref:hypothetical protein n=1 Tax=Alicyclobacillus sp. SO9 TaxID=2665646 RepID=UPI0018E6FAFD|nr:hypothetical protein [Alicyclobacillus sp. SO9]QQE80305.1 hypothetical protein GI364_07745 [Alicyclobacillus sp. SO9]
MLIFLLVLLLLIAVLCTYLRRKAVRWLFTILAILFWIAFLALLGFVIGYHLGQDHLHLSKLLF